MIWKNQLRVIKEEIEKRHQVMFMITTYVIKNSKETLSLILFEKQIEGDTCI